MNIIVAIDANWGIGCQGKLLTSIPEDMRFFRQKTEGKVIVMGHSTLKSLPSSKPLPNRINIVLSKNELLFVEGALVVNSIQALFNSLADYNNDDVFVIGGQEIYTLLLPYCKRAYITKVFSSYPADKHFPNIDMMENWEITEKSEIKNHNGVEFAFLTYINNNSL